MASILMPLRAYYDASGKPDLTTGFVTLSGISASDTVWPEFERDWGSVLADHPSISELHTTDAMSLNEEFEGWSRADVRKLLVKFFNVLGKYRAHHVEAFSCTLNLSDYWKAKRNIPSLRPPESICVDFCTGGITLPLEDAGKRKCVIFYFDRGDKFMHRINSVWERNKKVKVGWPRQVAAIVPVNSAEVLPVQAADMYAWFVNQYHISGTHEWAYFSLRMVLEHFEKLYDYDAIVQRYPNG
jgi:hypothetical protein